MSDKAVADIPRLNSKPQDLTDASELKQSRVRRRYSDSEIVVPPLPGKASKRQLPFRGDEGIFEESFIEERRQGLQYFINKTAGHPLAQKERCLHMFLQEKAIDRNYVSRKVRQ
ncbi:hypothetical protein FD755_013344 [Muntiacus reevesi]|uniref:PX domain-containing protein n=1 Tax=Muntiacus reevesi TaxID=9886 RepID=A0A5N3XNM4_MUNRE|nr:hypothetical protein FD755_013344 [Muntiacus reevesi]